MAKIRKYQSVEYLIDIDQLQSTINNLDNVYEAKNANIQTHVGSLHAPSNATVNSSDAVLLARANHTGTQAQSTVTNLVTDLAGKADSSAALALGETNVTAYRGDRGKTGYDHSQSAHSPSNAQANADITKTEIEAKLIGAISSHTHNYEPANTNIQAHVGSAHAPTNAQKNSDILKSEIEAVLTGQLSSHSHAGSGGSLDIALSFLTPTASETIPDNKSGMTYGFYEITSGLNLTIEGNGKFIIL